VIFGVSGLFAELTLSAAGGAASGCDPEDICAHAGGPHPRHATDVTSATTLENLLKFLQAFREGRLADA
jgi:hypothetical protein